MSRLRLSILDGLEFDRLREQSTYFFSMEDEDAEEKKIKVGTVGEWEERTPVPKHLSSKRFKLPRRKRSGGSMRRGFLFRWRKQY